MKRKWVVLGFFFIIILGNFIGYLLNHWKYSHTTHQLCIKEPYFGIVPIIGFSSKIPCIEMDIEGKPIIAEVDLGSSNVIALPKNLLKELKQKLFIEQVSYYGIRGKKYYSDIYEIPKARFGGMSIYKAKAQEINPEFIEDLNLGKKSDENFARVGWQLFYRLNIFLDCENNKIAFCDSLETLKKQGYPVEDFVETSMLLDRNNIEFEVMTQKGIIRCVLDTGSTLNMLNRDLESGSNEHMVFNPDNIDQHESLNPQNSDQSVIDLNNIYDAPVFKIGKKDFGKTTFSKIKIPYQIDAIVGMEFIYSKLIFLDFPNRKIYFYEKE